jgi:hypothetical protein
MRGDTLVGEPYLAVAGFCREPLAPSQEFAGRRFATVGELETAVLRALRRS